MSERTNSTDSNNTSRTLIATPLVAFQFPCSYLGKPQPIESPLPSALLGALLPPTLLVSESANSTKILDETDQNSVWFSCPRRTIDGIRSETILESENDIASLQYHNDPGFSSDSTATEPIAVASADTLAFEVWFTPLLSEENTDEAMENFLQPIVSIAEPLEIAKTPKSDIDNWREDPCERTQLMIGQRGHFLELVYRDHYEYLPEFDDDDFSLPRQYSCRILRLNQWKLGESHFENDGGEGADAVKGLHHLVVAWKKSGSVLEIFGNGKSIVSINLIPEHMMVNINSDIDFIRQWDPSYRLQIFSESSRFLGATDATDFTGKALFSGAIHHVALYKQNIDKGVAKSLYETGLEKRINPFQTFFENPNTHFGSIRLVASPSFSLFEEEKSDTNTSIRGVAVTQGGSAVISVGASEHSNSTTALWDVLVEVLTLPRYGELLYGDDVKNSSEDGYNIRVNVGDRLLLQEGSMRTNLEYRQLEDDYFSIPTHAYYGNALPQINLPGESFSYRLIAVKKKEREIDGHNVEETNLFLGVSDAIQQELTIVHKNHPPTFIGLPTEIVQPEWQPNGLGARPWATLGSSVVLNDESDYDIDRVRLDLWAEDGTLSIDLEDSEIRSIAEITSCSTPTPTGLGEEWICSGKNDRNMTLLATPSDVSRILSNLKYKALNWDSSDLIALRVYDGSGGLCPGRAILNTNVNHTIVDECYSIAAVVNVPPLSRTEGGPSSGNIWSDHRAWWISLTIFSAILFSICCCAIGCWRRLRRLKKLNDIAVSDLERPSVVLASPEESFPPNIGITEEDRMRVSVDLKQRNQNDDSV